MLKQCYRCSLSKDFGPARKRSNGLQQYCRDCMRELGRQYYHSSSHRRAAMRRNTSTRSATYRERLWLYLSTHPCVDCQEADIVVLEFDHIRGNKKYAVGDMIGKGLSWRSIVREIGKCVVRCANCHRRRTAKQQHWHITRFGLKVGPPASGAG